MCRKMSEFEENNEIPEERITSNKNNDVLNLSAENLISENKTQGAGKSIFQLLQNSGFPLIPPESCPNNTIF